MRLSCLILGCVPAVWGLGLALWILADLFWIPGRAQTAGSHQSGVDTQDGIDELLDSFIDPPARFIDLDQRDVFSPDDDQEIKGCTHYTCLDIYSCTTGVDSPHKKMLVHVPPSVAFLVDGGKSGNKPAIPSPSKEFLQVIQAIVESGYYTTDPAEACIFVPALDLLSESRVDSSEVASAALHKSSPYWNKGRNHVIITPYPADKVSMSIGYAIKAKAGLNTRNYRPGFDISLPSFSGGHHHRAATHVKKSWLLVMPQQHRAISDPNLLNVVKQLSENNPKLLKVTSPSKIESHLDLIVGATFCLVLDTHRDSGRVLMDILRHGCIPIVADDSAVLPFAEVLDWKRFSIRVYQRDVKNILDMAMDVSAERVEEMQKQVSFVYNKYFSSWKSVTKTMLDILNDRIVPQHTKTYREWNLRPEEYKRNPLFLPDANPAKEEGFTAVILTYNRLESLYNVINRIVDTPSLARIVVVWNNQEVAPPPPSEWPKISKTLKVIKTRANILSNRFYPYDEITTEAVLSLDDDIDMLTADELELGYQVWREFPDRLVGFPSRTHVVEEENGGKYRYESEWTSQISMVLTGASFYHKYWHYLYTAAPNPDAQDIKTWVDANMNCEDIAMNFLVANATGQPPIKVAPRKKFKCSTTGGGLCLNQELSLSGQQSHLTTRSECINMFSEKYGGMPLRTVEYRVDPVLYKDQVPDKLKAFVNVGSL